MTRRFVMKSIVVEGFKLLFDDLPQWFIDEMNISVFMKDDGDETNGCSIHTLEGEMFASKGDYIIKDIMGEIYPCKSEIFEATYEEVFEHG